MPSEELPDKKRRLIGATLVLVLRQGFAATSVDQICAEAGVTKGSFFHYFASKEEIGRVAMHAWSGGWDAILAASGIVELEDPLKRIDRLFEVMHATYLNADMPVGCVNGTIAQETAGSNETFRADCASHFDAWVDRVAAMLAEARVKHPPKVDFDPEEVARLLIALVQGSMLVAKAWQDREVIGANLRHAKSYLDGLFGRDS